MAISTRSNSVWVENTGRKPVWSSLNFINERMLESTSFSYNLYRTECYREGDSFCRLKRARWLCVLNRFLFSIWEVVCTRRTVLGHHVIIAGLSIMVLFILCPIWPRVWCFFTCNFGVALSGHFPSSLKFALSVRVCKNNSIGLNKSEKQQIIWPRIYRGCVVVLCS